MLIRNKVSNINLLIIILSKRKKISEKINKELITNFEDLSKANNKFIKIFDSKGKDIFFVYLNSVKNTMDYSNDDGEEINPKPNL